MFGKESCPSSILELARAGLFTTQEWMATHERASLRSTIYEIGLALIIRQSQVIAGLPDSAEDDDHPGRVLAVLMASRHSVYLPLPLGQVPQP